MILEDCWWSAVKKSHPTKNTLRILHQISIVSSSIFCLTACFTSNHQTLPSIQGQTCHGCIYHDMTFFEHLAKSVQLSRVSNPQPLNQEQSVWTVRPMRGLVLFFCKKTRVFIFHSVILSFDCVIFFCCSAINIWKSELAKMMSCHCMWNHNYSMIWPWIQTRKLSSFNNHLREQEC